MNRILVALNVDSAIEATTLADRLRGSVGGFKIGTSFLVVGRPITTATDPRATARQIAADIARSAAGAAAQAQ